MVVDKIEKNKIYFGMGTGAFYIIFGIIQFILGLGLGAELTEVLLIPNDIIGSFILVLIGVIFSFGVKELRANNLEGNAYIYIGIFLALIFSAIYLLVLAADAAEAYLLISEDFANWSPLDDIRPGIYLGILPLVGFLIWRRKFKLN
jgi:hypothetical protein